MSVALVWFERNLRLTDNPALHQAVQHGFQIIPFYIEDTCSNNPWPIGSSSLWWLHHSLWKLHHQLIAEGGKLFIETGIPSEIILKLVKDHKIDALFFEEAREPYSIARNQALVKQLSSLNLSVYPCSSHFLTNPSDIKTQNGDFFKVFSPYWQRCQKVLSLQPVLPKPHCHFFSMPAQAKTMNESFLANDAKKSLEQYWTPGEESAQSSLAKFIEDAVTLYEKNRNFPAIEGASRLSAHLHFGEISPNQVYQAILHQMSPSSAQESFLRQLGWREFFNYLLIHCPDLPEVNFQKKYDRFEWQKNDQYLSIWKAGKTGYPIVDAGMRELLATGFMHNRVRMITASFLTKDLLINWREGEKWFFEQLVDADLSNNAASWQWVAGCGPDPAPFFRVFNPTLQSKKFDPEGIYIKKWVPELAHVSKKWIHEPWLSPEPCLEYPKPMVNHEERRKIALKHYRQLSQWD